MLDPQESELDVLRRGLLSLFSLNSVDIFPGKIKQYEDEQAASKEAVTSLEDKNRLLEGTSKPHYGASYD